MTIIQCLDNRGGMLFNGRRQTLDYELASIIYEKYKDKLCICSFSESFFKDLKVKTYENPLSDAPDDAVVFIENIDITEHIQKIDEIIIYRWNRHYPADRHFSFEPTEMGYKLVGKVKFSTKIHEDTVKEIYRR